MEVYPGRLHHQVPGWVQQGSTYHIRIRTAAEYTHPLIERKVATTLLDSARLYHDSQRWYCRLLLLMPDHLHALLAFPPNETMSEIIGAWKGFQAKQQCISWQVNFFDHRIRSKNGLEEKAAYIRQNPVVKNLCRTAEEWPWVYSNDT